MNSPFFLIWKSLPKHEKVISGLVLMLLWGGIVAAVILAGTGIIGDPGSFFWGSVAGSVALSYLAYIKKKRDIVSLLTPVYALIIFTGLEIPPNLPLQIMFAASLTILLIRLHLRFS